MDHQLPPKIPLEHLPTKYRDHELIRDRVYYLLPPRLLDLVINRVGRDRFDDSLLAMELDLSEHFRAAVVGFWGGQLVHYPWLDRRRLILGAGFAEWALRNGWEQEQIDGVAAAEERADAVVKSLLGYAGWLMTNREFLDEHRRLFAATCDTLTSTYGIPRFGTVAGKIQELFQQVEPTPEQIAKGMRSPPYDALVPTNPQTEAADQFEAFFERWRLSALPAPFLPAPLGPQLPVVNVPQLLGHMGMGGQIYFLPDICPLPSKEELRAMLEAPLRPRQAPAHLAEWIEIVRASNKAKNQIEPFARIFKLQHFYKAVFSRHADALNRRKTHLDAALAEHFGLEAKTVERDLGEIATRLGTEWYLC